MYFIIFSLLLPKNIIAKTYRTVIFPVVLYGYKIGSLLLREELRLRLYKNRVLRKIFRTKMR